METSTDHSQAPVRGGLDGDAPTFTPHPRTLGWVGTTALAMGGSNQSLFLIGGAVGLIATQGGAAVPLLALGLLLGWLALPGWIELVLMWPKRVGGIAATCAEAFRPISPVLANLTGVCYWWGWVPTCGLTAFLSAKALHAWFLPAIPAKPLAVAIILGFLGVNLCGVRWAVRLALPIAAVSAVLAFLSGVIPIVTGNVDWRQATDYQLLTPFSGWFGGLTSAMAGLYLIGFAAPAFEQAACHVGETVDPARNVPRAMYASALMATLYFLVLPVVWLGVLGPGGLTGELQDVLGPTFAPLLGPAARAAAIGFMVFNMFHGCLAPLAGAARTLAQLAEDGLLPRAFGRRNRHDAPWVATTLTAAMAILFLLTDDPPWVIAAANLCYLIGICLPSVAIWLLRRSDPERARPYCASRRSLNLGVLAACIWGISTVFGFQQYGLPAVIAGVALAYAGSALYAWRLWEDRRRAGMAALVHSLHLKLTGTMIAVLTLDAVGYLLAVQAVDPTAHVLRVVLEDIFVAVALLTITVGLVLPGSITHIAEQLSHAAQQLATGTMGEFSQAMVALAAGDLDAAHARVNTPPVVVHTRDELGTMAASFNTLRAEIARSVVGLDGAREGLRTARSALTASNTQLLAEIEERKAFEAQLHHQAFHDTLTGLPNRALFFDRLTHALTRLERLGGAVAVLFLDLDRFKTINDSLGHQVGDRLLIAAGERLQGLIRGSDTLARLGGDEFTILLEHVGGTDEATRLAGRIAGALQRPFVVDGREIVAETSLGIVLSTPDLDSPTELLRAADVALYRAKARGKGHYEVFDPTMNAQALERLELEGDLRHALARGQFSLHYQPQIDLATGTLHGLEALVRWHHPRRGMVSPADFIPLAEETGLIRPIGRWVLAEACRQARDWQERHPAAAALVISVNLAAPEFQQPHLVEDIGQILVQTALPPHLLELEITESVVMDDVASAMTALRQLKGLGVRLAIDDFGTGYSSLSYLKRFQVDTLKIDKSFIDGLGADPEETAIVQAVVSLAHTLGLSVTAEGVETAEQAAQLRQLGCERAQGYLFARPLATDGIELLLDGGRLPHAMEHFTCRTSSQAITDAVGPWR